MGGSIREALGAYAVRARATGNLDAHVVTLTQLLSSFSWTYVYIFLPFYIQKISPYDRETTLLWTGLILGATGASTTFSAPFWGSMASRIRPRLLHQGGLLFQVVFMAAMGLTTSLPALLVLRLAIGLMGGISTIALVVISTTSPPARITPNVGNFQSALTLGQIVGPIVGAFSADLVGFRATFFVGALLMSGAWFFSYAFLAEIPKAKPAAAEGPLSLPRLAAAWAVCFAAQLQLGFLPSVLPEVMQGLQVAAAQAVRLSGLLVFAYGAAAVTGSYLLSRIALRLGPGVSVAAACIGGSLLQAGLGLTHAYWSFAAVRVLQCGLIAGVIPVVFAEVAKGGRGSTIGLINTSRFVGNAVGPFLATFFFAHLSPRSLYGLLAGYTLASLAAFVSTHRVWPFRGERARW